MFFSSYITVAVYRWLPLEQNPHAVVHLLWNLHRYFSSPFPVFAITSLPHITKNTSYHTSEKSPAS